MKQTSMTNPRNILLGFGLLLVAWGVYRASGFIRFAFTHHDLSPPKESILLIEKGAVPAKIARQLKKDQIISSARRFLSLGKLLGKWKEVKAGEYQVRSDMLPTEILDILVSGVSVSHPLTIQEGKNMYQIATLLDEKGLANKEKFLTLCKDPEMIKRLGFQSSPPPTLEGYLFPDTYLFTRAMNEQEMIIKMIQTFQDQWKPEFDQKAKKLKLTKQQVVTLASIIEKETGAPEERPIISSVFHNRLKKRMRLQSDPTTIYGMWSRFKGNIRRKHLQEKNDYNTYMISGLPKGPIANPGTEAIRAALHPKTSPYFYFVSRNDGTHEFTTTFKDHNQAVKRYQLNRKARQGKSWRDLHKKK